MYLLFFPISILIFDLSIHKQELIAALKIRYHFIQNLTIKLYPIWGLLLFFILNDSSAQTLSFSHLGVSEGLSQSTVNTIFQDSKGFMWFGTADGLNKYDGYQMKSYRNQGNTSTLSNYIGEKIVEDAQGDLWVSSRHGLNKYDHLKDQFMEFYPGGDTSYFDRWIDVLGIDNDGDLWCWDRNRTFYQYHINTDEIESIKMEDGESLFRQAVMDKDGNIWYNNMHGISRYNIYNHHFSNYLNEYFISINKSPLLASLSIDEEGILWMTSNPLVISFDTKKLVLIPNNLIQQFPEAKWNTVITQKGKVWLGTLNLGLLCYDKLSSTSHQYQQNKNDGASIASDIIMSIFIDRSENIWVSSDGFGLNKSDLKPAKFACYQSTTSDWKLSANFIKCFFEDPELRIWVGTHEGGINILDFKNHRLDVLKDASNKANTIACMARDLEGKLLIGTAEGLYYIDEKTFHKTYIPTDREGVNNPGDHKILDILNTQEHTTLVSSAFGIYEAVYENHRIVKIKAIPITLGNFIGRLYQTKDGKIFAASTEGAFVKIYSYTNNVFVKKSTIINGINVRSLYEDTKNNLLWMGSDKGLIRYDLKSENYTFVNEKQGLANTHLYGLLCDSLGRLWVSSNKGISIYDPRTDRCRNYDINDGLQSNEFNSGAYFKSRSNEFYFGGINGFNVFNPLHIQDNQYTPNVALTRFMVNDEGALKYGNPAYLKDIVLGPSSNTLAFDFAALEFTQPEKNEYQYKLAGNDKDWVYAGNKHAARYSKLAPGQYRLYVRASNNDGVWSSDILLCTITIQSPWWQTWWAILIFVFFLGLAVYSVFRLIVHRKLQEQKLIIDKQKALEQERSRISKDMHDDLGSGLTKIAIMTELLKSKDKSENTNAQIEKISNTTHELIDNMSQIIWAMNPENDHIENILGYLRKFTLDFFEDSNIKCVLNFPEHATHIILSQFERRNLFLIIKETYHNILKHSGATLVNITVTLTSKKIKVTIEDNGKGFELKDAIKRGNGLNNMQKRMNDLNGIYHIQSSIGNGCITTLELNSL